MITSRFFGILLLIVSGIILDRKNTPEFNLNVLLTRRGSDVQFFQQDYNFTIERMEVMSHNKNYVNCFKILTFKYNRTTTAYNITANFKFDVAVGTVQVVQQAFKFASNEYRLFPMRYQYDYCKSFAANVGGMGTSTCGNFSRCPFLKEKTYHACRWTLDQRKFPPYIPTGRYKLEHQFLYKSTEIALINSYITITRPEVTRYEYK